MDDVPARLLLPPAVWEEIQAHAQACLPEEACGLLGGVSDGGGALARMALPVENALHSPVRFRMDPRAQLAAFQAIEAAGLELLAIFHSHPRGPRAPSATDLAEFAYPGVLSLILFPDPAGGLSGRWSARAFHIRAAFRSGERPPGYDEIPLLVDTPV